jgi:uncharacterized membrane protein YbhN (UPF0104 family)
VGLLLMTVDLRATWAHIASASLVSFVQVLACAIAATLISAVRWATIARGLGSRVRTLQAIVFYLRGVTINTLLPGATVGGDAFRAFQMVRVGNGVAQSTFSVVLDRLAGLWAQAALSLAAAAVYLVSSSGEALTPVLAYTAFLAVIVIAPWLPFERIPVPERGVLRRAAGLWDIWRRIRGERQRLLARVTLLAVGVAFMSTSAFWFCLRAVGLDLAFVDTLLIAAAIFIAASIPIALAGFGPREIGAAAVFAIMGGSVAPATAASVLYGLSATVQGIFAAVLFAWQPRSGQQSNTASTP